ncbi:MAG: relaxase/mobilization nuclease domain-containing protein [Leptolyngbyaceae cyanobacterium RM1_406_9]|nr:relaxase/mobilization nuclease domain-containing protein [Leptolyngbyaceae cyanobacterium SM1_4_3]NJO73998.1 relaxase/mobilization nuclease domain-containing protein [Leptolyngbyaceae cyanobacterium RM1_406_9]
MIGKQIKGRSFSKLLNYLFGKDGASLIGSNMEGTVPCELAAEFRFSQQLNPKVNRVVYHASLSLPHTEHLKNDIWYEIAKKYLQAMGFDMNQYAVVRHSDRDHDHAHIVASRIRLDGTTVSDSWDYHRSEVAIRQLEQEYGLQSLHSSQEKDSRSPTTGEQRLLARTGEESVRVQLQRSLDQATQSSLTMPQLIEQLQQKGISIRVSNHQTDQIKGISYELNGVAFSGTHLGKAYTFTGLQKYRGVDYDSHRDNQLIKKLIEQPINSSTEIDIEPDSFVQVSITGESQRNDNAAKNRKKSKLAKYQQRELEL